MSRSNDAASRADKGGYGEATNLLYNALPSEAREQKKRNLATVTIVDPPTRKMKGNSWKWIRSGEYMPIKLKAREMSLFGKRAVVECILDRNQTEDLI